MYSGGYLALATRSRAVLEGRGTRKLRSPSSTTLHHRTTTSVLLLYHSTNVSVMLLHKHVSTAAVRLADVVPSFKHAGTTPAPIWARVGQYKSVWEYA
eukprot:2537400-Rhodomonas_salina.3